MLTNETLYTMVACQTYKNQALNLRFPEIIRCRCKRATFFCQFIAVFMVIPSYFGGLTKLCYISWWNRLELVVPKITAKEGEPPLHLEEPDYWPSLRRNEGHWSQNWAKSGSSKWRGSLPPSFAVILGTGRDPAYRGAG